MNYTELYYTNYLLIDILLMLTLFKEIPIFIFPCKCHELPTKDNFYFLPNMFCSLTRLKRKAAFFRQRQRQQSKSIIMSMISQMWFGCILLIQLTDFQFITTIVSWIQLENLFQFITREKENLLLYCRFILFCFALNAYS